MDETNLSVVSLSDIGTLDDTSHRTLNTIRLIISVICELINIVGVVTNTINIICFIKQGFKDPVNISLTGRSFPGSFYMCRVGSIINMRVGGKRGCVRSRKSATHR